MQDNEFTSQNISTSSFINIRQTMLDSFPMGSLILVSGKTWVPVRVFLTLLELTSLFAFRAKERELVQLHYPEVEIWQTVSWSFQKLNYFWDPYLFIRFD